MAMYQRLLYLVLFAASLSCRAFPLVEKSLVQTGYSGVSRPMNKSPRYGYDGPPVNEKSFDDVAYFNGTGAFIVGICSIDICFGDSVDYIQVTYFLSNSLCKQAPRRGSNSCQSQLHTITLDTQANEYVTKVEGSTKGSLVNHLTFYTLKPGDENRSFGPFGKPGTINYSIEGYIAGFYGRYENLLITIGAYYLNTLKRSQLYGVQPAAGIALGFDDNIDGYVPAIVGVSKLHIWHGKKINAFQAEYVLLNNQTMLGEKHGGEGTRLPANLTTIELHKGERIVTIQGKRDRSYYTYLDEISFVTKNKYGKYKEYGPFGYGLFDDEIKFSGNICGFFGSTSTYVYGIGVYYF